MIGQPHINYFITNFSTKLSPKCHLIVGESGCGKHTLVKEISRKCSVPDKDITEVINGDLINTLYERTVSALYVVDLNTVQPKKQNILLKIVEEPPMGVFIFLLASSITKVLPTIKNRCSVTVFQPYSVSDLSKFIPIGEDKESIDRLLSVCRTPGQIKNCLGVDLGGLLDLSSKVVDKIGTANISNTLTIVNKLAFKSEKNLYDHSLFYKTLIYAIEKKALTDTRENLSKAIECVVHHEHIEKSYNVDKKANIENMLLNLWEIFREDDHKGIKE